MIQMNGNRMRPTLDYSAKNNNKNNKYILFFIRKLKIGKKFQTAEHA